MLEYLNSSADQPLGMLRVVFSSHHIHVGIVPAHHEHLDTEWYCPAYFHREPHLPNAANVLTYLRCVTAHGGAGSTRARVRKDELPVESVAPPPIVESRSLQDVLVKCTLNLLSISCLQHLAALRLHLYWVVLCNV